MTSPRWDLGVVADDLTGGAAIAGELAARGTPTLVTRTATVDGDTRAVVFDTGSRHLRRDEAVQKVVAATQRLRHDVSLAMKKVDSGLQGNVAHEVGAFVEQWAAPVVVAPACPEVGWRTVHGRQVHDRHPGIDVAAIIARTTGEKPALLGLDVVRAGSGSVARALRRAGATVALIDATTVEELAVLVRGAVEAGVTGFAGTYGLGAALAPFVGSNEAGSGRTGSGRTGSGRTGLHEAGLHGAGAVTGGARRVLVVVGSMADMARRQVDHLRRSGVEEVAVELAALRDGRGAAETSRVRRAVAACQGPIVLLHTAPGQPDRDGAPAGGAVEHLAPVFAPVLAEAAAGNDRDTVDTVRFLVGGETAGTVADGLGLDPLIVERELAPGVPLARARDGRLVITKPGAFGNPSTVTEVARRATLHPHPDRSSELHGPVDSG